MNFIRQKADILAPKVEMNFKGESKVFHWKSLLLSFVAFGLTVVVFANGIYELIHNENPKITVDRTTSGGYGKFDLDADDVLPIFFLWAGKNPSIPLDTTNYTQYMSINYQILNKTNGNVKSFPANLVMCSSLDSQMASSGGVPYFKRENVSLDANALYEIMTYGICLNDTAFADVVQGDPIFGDSTVASLVIQPCASDLYTCAASTSLSSVIANIAFLYPIENMTHFDKPVGMTIDWDLYLYLMKGTTQLYKQHLKRAEVFNARPDFFWPAKLAASYSYYEYAPASLIERDNTITSCLNATLSSPTTCPPYIQIQFVSSTAYTKYLRTYVGVLDTLGQVGGNFGNISMLLGIVVGILMGKVVMVEILQLIYKISSESPSLGCCKKRASKVELKVGSLKDGKEPKDKLQVVDADTMDLAIEMVKEDLDLVTLAKTVRDVKFLKSILLKNYHEDAIPTLVLAEKAKQDALENQKKAEAEASKTKSSPQKPGEESNVKIEIPFGGKEEARESNQGDKESDTVSDLIDKKCLNLLNAIPDYAPAKDCQKAIETKSTLQPSSSSTKTEYQKATIVVATNKVNPAVELKMNPIGEKAKL